MIPSLRLHAGRYEIRIAPVPAILALFFLALLLGAGFWQLGRAQDKRDLQVEQAYRSVKEPLVITPRLTDDARIERLRNRRAVATGHYRGDRQYLLDNRTHRQVAGYHVLTPLRLEDGRVHVLVNRGWVPTGPDRARLPDVAVSGDRLRETGTIVAPPSPGLSLGATGFDAPGWPRVIQQVDMARIAEQLGSPVLPFVLRLSPDSSHGYIREWQVRTGLSPERHVGYAVQWFALAAALVVLCAWVAVRPGVKEGARDA